MIIINQCRIDPDLNKLVIEATVDSLDYYNNIFIESLRIDTEETYNQYGPSGNYVYEKDFTSDDVMVGTESSCGSLKTDSDCKCGNVFSPYVNGVKHIYLMLSPKDINVSDFNNHIFFVYLKANGIVSGMCPCGMDNEWTMGIAYNLRPIYNRSMVYIKELDNSCTIPKGFIDMILRIKAFEYSLKTGNTITAFKQWDKLIKTESSVRPAKNCGCNGLN